MKSLLFAFTIILFVSCSTTKSTSDTTSPKENTMSESKKMMENGFTAGTIIASQAEGDCPYVIEIKGENGATLLDPINLDASYQKDGQKVWFTYSGLRMMNRCVKANPVSIKEIQKRTE